MSIGPRPGEIPVSAGPNRGLRAEKSPLLIRYDTRTHFARPPAQKYCGRGSESILMLDGEFHENRDAQERHVIMGGDDS
jgi:hypothetical protein